MTFNKSIFGLGELETAKQKSKKTKQRIYFVRSSKRFMYRITFISIVASFFVQILLLIDTE